MGFDYGRRAVEFFLRECRLILARGGTLSEDAKHYYSMPRERLELIAVRRAQQ